MSLKLPASATLADASALVGRLGDGVESVDCAALQNFDTSAIALLLEARRRAQARGLGFTVVNAPPKLRELARLYGVESLLSFETT